MIKTEPHNFVDGICGSCKVSKLAMEPQERLIGKPKFHDTKMPKETEDALWQYFMDHANVHRAPGKRPCWLIIFSVRDQQDFNRRLTARLQGSYKRYELEDKALNLHAAKVQFFNHRMRRAKKFAKKTWLGRILSYTHDITTHAVLKYNLDV